MLEDIDLRVYFRKHRMQPPPRALNAPPEEGGAGRSWGRCAHTLGQPARHHLALVGYWLGLDGSLAGILVQLCSLDGLACCFAQIRLLESAC
jgi:hypothetical protein